MQAERRASSCVTHIFQRGRIAAVQGRFFDTAVVSRYFPNLPTGLQSEVSIGLASPVTPETLSRRGRG